MTTKRTRNEMRAFVRWDAAIWKAIALADIDVDPLDVPFECPCCARLAMIDEQCACGFWVDQWDMLNALFAMRFQVAMWAPA